MPTLMKAPGEDDRHIQLFAILAMFFVITGFFIYLSWDRGVRYVVFYLLADSANATVEEITQVDSNDPHLPGIFIQGGTSGRLISRHSIDLLYLTFKHPDGDQIHVDHAVISEGNTLEIGDHTTVYFNRRFSEHYYPAEVIADWKGDLKTLSVSCCRNCLILLVAVEDTVLHSV